MYLNKINDIEKHVTNMHNLKTLALGDNPISKENILLIQELLPNCRIYD